LVYNKHTLLIYKNFTDIQITKELIMFVEILLIRSIRVPLVT